MGLTLVTVLFPIGISLAVYLYLRPFRKRINNLSREVEAIWNDLEPVKKRLKRRTNKRG